ncbi:MAG: GNAT family N-acetyltransferase [Pseudomonadota bacterium]|nr:GNAT family N-acetyltransferase [Pseudomonadota bacterium]
MDEIEISPLRLDEADAVVALAGRVWRAHYPGIISSDQIEYMLAQRYRSVLVRQFIARGDVWLAARAGSAKTGWVKSELVGFVHGHPLVEGDYKLDKLYVQTELQRHGIGGRLIDEFSRLARARGIARLVLRVNRQNHNAIRAYLKHGFKIATLIDEEIGDGFRMEDYVMARELVTESA